MRCLITGISGFAGRHLAALLLARGERIKEIAQEIGLNAKTVTTYRTRILAKMNMRNNADLTTYAHKHNLI